MGRGRMNRTKSDELEEVGWIGSWMDWESDESEKDVEGGIVWMTAPY